MKILKKNNDADELLIGLGVVIAIIVVIVAIVLLVPFEPTVITCDECGWSGYLDNCTVETTVDYVPYTFIDSDGDVTIRYHYVYTYYYYCPECGELLDTYTLYVG